MNKKENEYSIFRSEALQHKREGWLGSSRLNVSASLSFFLVIGMMTSIFLSMTIIFGSYSERVNVAGIVVFDPPAVALMAQRDGIINHSAVSEGTVISQGKLLFSVSNDIKTNLGSANAEALELLKKQRDAVSNKKELITKEADDESVFLMEKIKNKEQEINRLDSYIEDLGAQKAWFAEKLKVYATFRGKGMALDADLIDRRKDYYLAAENLSSAKVKIVTLRGELLDLQKKASSVKPVLEEKVKTLVIETADIDQKILEVEKNIEYLITAPFSGMITSVTAHHGERVAAGQRLAILVPQLSAARIELLATSDSLGEVVRGLRVKMRIAAWPYQWYGKIDGVVETISAAPVNPISPVGVKNDNSAKGLFRIIVRPELTERQRSLSLLPGMEVETEIYVKTRKIYEWLFMPVSRAYKRAKDSME